MSFFTRKLEAQLRFQQIPWRYLFKTEERKADLEAQANIAAGLSGEKHYEVFTRNTACNAPMGQARFSVLSARYHQGRVLFAYTALELELPAAVCKRAGIDNEAIQTYCIVQAITFGV